MFEEFCFLIQIDGHGDYIRNLDIIMKAVGVRTKDELKPTVPKSGSKTNIPKVAGSDTSKSDNYNTSSAKQKKENQESSNAVERASLGELQRTNEELDNVNNEQKEHSATADLKTAKPVPNSNIIDSTVNSVDDGHASGRDTNEVHDESKQENKSKENTNLKTENFEKKKEQENKSKEDTDLKTETYDRAKWESANEENSLSSIDYTSSESEPPSKEHTPEVVFSHYQKLPIDLNASAKEKQEHEDNLTKIADTKSETEQRHSELSEMRTAKRVEDEINELIKSKTPVKVEESCYFTDSDPDEADD